MLNLFLFMFFQNVNGITKIKVGITKNNVEITKIKAKNKK